MHNSLELMGLVILLMVIIMLIVNIIIKRSYSN